jgi:hypothetical protein
MLVLAPRSVHALPSAQHPSTPAEMFLRKCLRGLANKSARAQVKKALQKESKTLLQTLNDQGVICIICHKCHMMYMTI